MAGRRCRCGSPAPPVSGLFFPGRTARLADRGHFPVCPRDGAGSSRETNTGVGTGECRAGHSPVAGGGVSGRQRGRGQASAARAGLPAVGVGTVAEGPRDLSGRQKLPTSEALESRASLGRGATARPEHGWPSSCLPAQSPLVLGARRLLEKCPQAPAQPLKAGRSGWVRGSEAVSRTSSPPVAGSDVGVSGCPGSLRNGRGPCGKSQAAMAVQQFTSFHVWCRGEWGAETHPPAPHPV